MTRYNKRILNIKDNLTRAYYKYLWRQVHENNFGYFGIITGIPGMGKSETALMQAWIQDDTFNEDNLEDKYIRNAKDFINRVDSADKHEWLVWGETALSLSSQRWYSMSNMIVDDVIQTMRTKELGVIFDTPNIMHIDKRARDLFQWYCNVSRFEKSPVYMQIHRVFVNERYNKTFYPHPKFNINGVISKLRGIVVKGRLPKDIIDSFDILHKAFKDEITKKHIKNLDLIDQAESVTDVWGTIERIKLNLNEYKNNKDKIDKDIIMLKEGLSRDRATQVVKWIEKTI